MGHDLNVDIVMCVKLFLDRRHVECTIIANPFDMVKAYVPEGLKSKVCNYASSRFKHVPLKEIEKCVMEFVEDE